MHHLYDPVASPSLHMGSTLVTNSPQMPCLAANGPSPQVTPNASTSPAVNYSLGKRQSSHPLKSFSVPAPPPAPPLSSLTPHNCESNHCIFVPINKSVLVVRPQPISSPNKKMALNGINTSSHKSINAVTPTRDSLRREDLSVRILI